MSYERRISSNPDLEDLGIQRSYMLHEQAVKGEPLATSIVRTISDGLKPYKVLAHSFFAEGGSPPPLTSIKFNPDLVKNVLDGRNWGQIFAAVDQLEEFPEDSVWLKILSAIPLIGIISSTICGITLENKLDAGGTNNRRARLLDITQDYRICSLVRELLTVALAVTVLALATLSVAGIVFGAGVIAIGLTIAAWHAYKFAINQQFNDSFKQNNGIFT